MKNFDYCKLFADIERDPRAMVQLTIGQYLGARVHIDECANCAEVVDRVNSRFPDDRNTIGFHPN